MQDINLKTKKKFLNFALSFFILIFAFLVLPTLSAEAHTWNWNGPIVPCGTPGTQPCQRCDLVHLLKHLIDFGLFAIIPIGGVALFMLAGIFYMLGSGNPAFLGQAKNLFTNTLYGIAVIVLAWLITNTIIGGLGRGGSWGSFVCVNPVIPTPVPVPSGTPTPTGPTPTATPVSCDGATLAKQYGTRYPSGNSLELDKLIRCVEADSKVAGMLDLNQINTIQRTPPPQADLCNYTRGNKLPACGVNSCAHSVNSCHYGGAGGSNGAEGVDFNVTGETQMREETLYQYLRDIQVKCNFKWVNFETTYVSGVAHWHSHVATRACDKF